MRKLNACKVVLVAVAVLLVSMNGCGSGAKNDQGVSFTFLGWFTAGGTGVTGATVPISDANPEEAGASGVLVLAAGLQNNLSGQIIRGQRARHVYYIPGSLVQPPPTNVAVAVIVGPASGNAPPPFGEGSTLPGNLDTVADVVYAQIPIITADVREWMNLNRGSLPELPFTMAVVTEVTGVTSSGQSITTNEIQIELIFTPDNVIPPTSGSAGNSEGSSSSV